MLCPLRKYINSDYAKCLKKDCAWWFGTVRPNDECCVINAIADALQHIQLYLKKQLEVK